MRELGTDHPLKPQGAKVYRWLHRLLPLLIIGVSLWLLTLIFGGRLSLDHPWSLVVTTLVLSGMLWVGQQLLDVWHHKATHDSFLPQQTSDTLTAIAQAAQTDHPSEAIAAVLRQALSTALHTTVIEIVLFDPRTEQYRFRGQRRLRLSIPSSKATHLVDQPIGKPISTDSLTPSADADSFPSKIVTAMHDAGILTVIPLGMPGWIGLNCHIDQLTPTECAFLEQIVRAASVELRYVIRTQSEQLRTEELQVLHWIARAVNFTMDADDVLELVYTQLKRVVRLPNFYIALIDPESEQFRFRFYVEGGKRLYPDHSWPVTEGLTGILVKNNSTIRTNDYTEECRRRDLEPTGLKPGHAWMGTALTAGDKSIGVMVASTFDPDTIFTQAEERVFVTAAAYTAAILERQTLRGRLDSRARQLATLNEIGMLLASSLDLDEVLDLVVRNAAELLDSEAGSLLLLDETTGDLVFRISSGPAGKHLVGMRIPAGKGIAGAAFSENRPVISHNARRDNRWYSEFDSRAEFVTQSVIAVPLNARGRTIGVLEVVNRKSRRPFTEEDSELLLSFASQAAIAIENARLFTTTDQALQAHVQELMTLQYIDRQLNATLDYHQVMDQTLEWALHITGATIGMVAAVQEDERGQPGLRFLAHKGYDDDLFSRYSGDELWPLSEGLIGHTVRLGKTTLITDVSQAPQYYEVVPGMKAQLSVPIKREERVIGIVVLESAEANTFNTENVAFIERLADHAAIAIDNARLFGQVQKANAAKTEFISFVSHELKQPMTSIRGYADLLAKGVGGPLNEQQLQFLSVVRRNVQRMDRLVQDLLDISRIEAGRLKLEMGPVDPAEIVTEAVQAFREAIAAKEQRLHVEIAEGLPKVIGDRGRLIQVLTNLISNANKYTPKGGTITVRTEAVSENGTLGVRWQVSDTGIGLTPNELGQLFTKYFRSQRDAVRSVQGTGLGLAITQSIVEMHGGHMHVESEPDKGSTFSFTLPVASSGGS